MGKKMKYKTMKQYQEGGFFGRSRPLSTKRMLHKIGQKRDVKTAQEEFDEQFKKVKNKVGLLGIADMIIQGTSKTVLPPVIGDVVGSLTSDALKRSVPRVTTDDSPTGYLQSDFETLSEYEKLQGTDALNRALGKGASGVVKFAGDKVGGLKGIKDRLKLLNLESKPMPELTTGFGVASVPMGIAEKPLPFSLQNFLSKQLIGLEDLPINIPTESNQSTGLTQGNSSWDAGFGNFMASLGEEYQEGGEVDSDSLQQALAKKPMMDFFMRDFKDPRKKELKSSVMSGEVEPRDALQMLLNMQTADYLKSTGDTTNVLFDRLKEAGYQDGGEVQDNTATNIMNLLALSDMAERTPQYSMFDAGSRGGVFSEEDILGISEGNFIPVAGILNKGYAGIFGSGDVTLSKIKKLLMSDRFNRGGEGSMLRQLSKQSPTMSDFVRNVSRTGNEELADRYAKKLIKEAKDVYKKSYQEGGDIMSEYYGGGMAKKKKKKKYGYMGGGLLDMMPYARRIV